MCQAPWLFLWQCCSLQLLQPGLLAVKCSHFANSVIICPSIISNWQRTASTDFLLMLVSLLLEHSWWPWWLMCLLGLYLEYNSGSSGLSKYIHSSTPLSLNLFVLPSIIFQGSTGISSSLRVIIGFLRLLHAKPSESLPRPWRKVLFKALKPMSECLQVNEFLLVYSDSPTFLSSTLRI